MPVHPNVEALEYQGTIKTKQEAIRINHYLNDLFEEIGSSSSVIEARDKVFEEVYDNIPFQSQFQTEGEQILEQEAPKTHQRLDIDSLLSLPDSQLLSSSKGNENIKLFKASEIDPSTYHQYISKLSTHEYSCNVCEKITKSFQGAKLHLETHIEGLSYECDICGKRLGNKNSLNTHRHNFHRHLDKRERYMARFMFLKRQSRIPI